MDEQWKPDGLGKDFEQLTLPLTETGPATLVRYRPSAEPVIDMAAAGSNILYIHGWSDYFFQANLARFWHRHGARFYAVDLHCYGRSLRVGQTPGYVADLIEYDDDIQAALDVIAVEPNNDSTSGTLDGTERPLILMGHSAGGLTLSWWAHRNPGLASALVLNSPWLEFQGAELGRRAIAPLVQLRARFNPLAPLPAIDPGIYSRAVSSGFEGTWTYNEQWRPARGFAVTPAFLNAIFQAQAAVATGLSIDCPVLVMLSDKDYLQPRWSESATRADVALNVHAVAHRALSLGDTVTIVRIKNAMHDIFLSEDSVRQEAYAQIERWLNGYGGRPVQIASATSP
ncbi:alpha/beta hydrolase [Arthrobacter roseus]|uniref:alpha/beta hydrolase n=1 Tax=Arthrobacter roseus TaxID=136274 RepID=UPI0019623215|nr:alpha/beta hydrolase [Arthrobacter roseus]MBM7848144.1 alpha-beta hydrolase superfamily lysophospholipase [Arthrobacter roseus]